MNNQSTEIVIIRHGESLANKERIMIGQSDYDLSDRGREQAAATAEFLKNEHFDAIYSSDLCRAYNTALPNAKLRGLEIITDEGLRESYVGLWEERYFADLEDNESELMRSWRQSFGHMVFPGGESTYDSGMRFHDAVVRIAKANPGRRILIATHAGVIRAFWGIINSVSKDEMGEAFPFATNASCSYLSFDGERLIPGEYSVNAHLESIGFIKTRRPSEENK